MIKIDALLCFLFSALVAINLITLWVDSRHNRRILLLSLNMVLHFFAVQHMFWALPHNGDTIPDICKCPTHKNSKQTYSDSHFKINSTRSRHIWSKSIWLICVNMCILVARKEANHREEIIVAKIFLSKFTLSNGTIRVSHEFTRTFIHSFTSFHITNIRIIRQMTARPKWTFHLRKTREYD